MIEQQRGVKVQGIVHWAIPVNDLEESRRFYTEVLGMVDRGPVGPQMRCVRFGETDILLSVRPTRGLVSVFGEEVSGISNDALTGLRRRMGVVFQDFRLLDHLTTYENVALPLRVQERAEASYRAEVVELLRWVGLGERMHVLPPLLSGGEKQRAAIARALIARPDLLLADEPTGNVDPALGRRLLRLFLELNKLGTSVIIATHDFGIMDAVNARRMVLNAGRLRIEE